MERVLLWDFDGTLAHRPGMWSGCMLETLDEHLPGHGVELDRIRPFMRDGFPWHTPEVAHHELSAPGAWWAHVEGLVAAAFHGVGIDPAAANRLARLTRDRYLDVLRAWALYPDVVPVLTELRAAGWRHTILSNHVPELPSLVDGLGLSALVELVHTSAATGYEKPNPAAFDCMREECGRPAEIWMIGDNPVADVAGAEAAGIPAILARTVHEGAKRRVADLYGIAAVLAAGPGP